MPSNSGVGCLHFFHLVDRVTRTHSCGLTRCKKTLSFAKVGLGKEELDRIVDIELERVQERIHAASTGKPFLIYVTGAAREFLLREGTDSDMALAR